MQISEKEWKELKRKEKILRDASDTLKVEPKDLPRVIKRFKDEVKKMKEKLN